MDIKVCGMRDVDNITKLVQLPIKFIGFIFYDKSPRYVGNSDAEKIISVIPNNIYKTGVFVNASIPDILQYSSNFKLQAIQLHGSESPEFCSNIKSLTKNIIIKAFGVDDDFDFSILEKYEDVCDYFLFDTKSKNHGGTGLKFDWDILKKYKSSKQIFLSGGITIDDVDAIKNLKNINIAALDLNSRFEIKPALKDIDLLSYFIDRLNSK